MQHPTIESIGADEYQYTVKVLRGASSDEWEAELPPGTKVGYYPLRAQGMQCGMAMAYLNGEFIGTWNTSGFGTVPLP